MSTKARVLRTICALSITTPLFYAAPWAYAVPYSDSVLADNPIAYYRFEETSGTNADNETGNASYDATYNSAADLTAAGPASPGFGLTNSATNFVPAGAAVNTPVSLNALSAFTLELWFRLPATLTIGRLGMVGQDNIIEFGFIDPFTIQLWTEANNLGFNTTFDTSNSANLDRWVHLVGVGTGSESLLYLDGVLANFVSYTPLVDYGSNMNLFNIGGDPIFGFDGGSFPGDIDEVAIYDTSLTAEQIRAHYNAAVGVPEPSTVALMGLGLAGLGFTRRRMKA